MNIQVNKKFNLSEKKLDFYDGYSLTPYLKDEKIINFSPGPTSIPTQVLSEFLSEFSDKNKFGVTPLEISHRSPEFLNIKKECEKKFRTLLKIPDNYSLIWTHGGGHGQFSGVPLNLVKDQNDSPNYLVTGTWSNRSYLEASKYCNPNKIIEKEDISEIDSIDYSKIINNLKDNSSYVYLCSNETINGLEFREDGIPVPSKDMTNNKIMVVDMSSDILSKKVNWNNVDVAFACAPKNFGFPGSAVTIINNKILLEDYKRFHEKTIPSLLDWKLINNSESFWNTLPVFNIYITDKILSYYINIGGIDTIEANSKSKSDIIYSILDENNIYEPVVEKGRPERSRMNIPFIIKNKEMMELFIHNAYRNNIVGLRTKTPFNKSDKPEPLRISLYNSITLEDTIRLSAFMIEFNSFISM